MVTDMDPGQRAVLAEIARPDGSPTPQNIADQFNARGDGTIYPPATQYSWQGVARIAGQLARQGLIKVHRLPKLTWYEVTRAGRAVLETERTEE